MERRERIGRLMWFREEIGMPGDLYQGAPIMPSENGGQIAFTLRQPQTYHFASFGVIHESHPMISSVCILELMIEW